MSTKSKNAEDSKAQYNDKTCVLNLNEDILMHVFLLSDFKDAVNRINSEILDYKNILSLKNTDQFDAKIGTAFKFYTKNRTFERKITNFLLQQNEHLGRLQLVCMGFCKLKIMLRTSYVRTKSLLLKNLRITSSLYKKVIQAYFTRFDKTLRLDYDVKNAKFYN